MRTFDMRSLQACKHSINSSILVAVNVVNILTFLVRRLRCCGTHLGADPFVRPAYSRKSFILVPI